MESFRTGVDMVVGMAVDQISVAVLMGVDVGTLRGRNGNLIYANGFHFWEHKATIADTACKFLAIYLKPHIKEKFRFQDEIGTLLQSYDKLIQCTAL